MANSNMEILMGDPKSSILKLSIPIIITMLVTTLYNVVDGMWVVGLGIDATAGIGLVTPLWMIINGVATGFANGITSSIIRLRGGYGEEKSDEAASQSIIILLIVSIVITAILLLILNPFIVLYSPSETAAREAFNYSIPLFLGLFGFVFSCGFSGILRAEGDTKRAMYATTFGIILNAIFDPIFIYTFNWGSAGASISTIVTSLISAAIMYYWIFIRRDTYININIRKTLKSRWDWNISQDVLTTGIPASAVLFMLSFSTMIFYYFIRIISGDLGIAIFSSANRIYLLGLTPIIATSYAMVAIVGTHYGEGNISYVKRAHTFGCIYALVLGLAICVLFVTFKNQLAYIFLLTINSPELFEGIAEFVAVISLCIPFMGIGMPSSYLYRGLGKGIISFFWTVLYEIVFTVPAIYLFAFIMNYGLIGVWMGLVAGRGITGVLNFIGARYTIAKLEKH